MFCFGFWKFVFQYYWVIVEEGVDFVWFVFEQVGEIVFYGFE